MRATIVVCDLDEPGSQQAAVGAVELVVDGVTRSIDVCAHHLALLEALPPAASTRHPRQSARPRAQSASSGRRARARVPGSRRDRQSELARARDWARAQGMRVADRGRLPQGVLDSYRQAARQR